MAVIDNRRSTNVKTLQRRCQLAPENVRGSEIRTLQDPLNQVVHQKGVGVAASQPGRPHVPMRVDEAGRYDLVAAVEDFDLSFRRGGGEVRDGDRRCNCGDLVAPDQNVGLDARGAVVRVVNYDGAVLEQQERVWACAWCHGCYCTKSLCRSETTLLSLLSWNASLVASFSYVRVWRKRV